MSENNDVKTLMINLHQLQRRLFSLRERLRRGPMLIAAHERNVVRANDNLEKTRTEYKKLQVEANDKEQQMSSADTAIKRRKTQLSEAKSNKEYSALQSQIAADESANSVLTDEVLEAIERAEKFKPKVAEMEAELKKVEEQLKMVKQNIVNEEPLIKADVARLESELAAEEAKLPETFRELYNRLVVTRGGAEALSEIADQKFCSGCNQQIPINSLAKVLQQHPVACSSCGRLLYVSSDYVFDRG
jgi:predicted  nucleic acid-binding Zn-ribbon protein